MIEPVSAVSTLSSSLTATVTAANFLYALHNTPKDVRACAQLVTRVYDDLQFLKGLRNANQDYFCSKSAPAESSSVRESERKRVDGIINEAELSLLAIGSKLEACRAEANGGRVPLMGRMKWVLGDSASFVLHSRNLGVQQAAINAEIGWLRGLDMKKAIVEKVDQKMDVITAFENLDLLRMSSRKSISRDVLEMRDNISTIQPPALPPPYQESAHHMNLNSFHTPAEEFAWGQSQYLEPENRTSYPSFGTESRPRSALNSYPIQFHPVDKCDTLDIKQTADRNRSISNLETPLQPVALSLHQLQPQRASISSSSTVSMSSSTSSPNASVNLQWQAADRRENVASQYTSPQISFSNFEPAPILIAPSTTSYPHFNLPYPEDCQSQKPPLPPRPPKNMPSWPSQPTMTSNTGRPSETLSANHSTPFVDDAWCPTTEISYQLPYMPISSPAPSVTPLPTFSEEKIAISYKPFDHQARLDLEYGNINGISRNETPTLSELYPLPLNLTQKTAWTMGYPSTESDKMTVSSMASTPRSSFASPSNSDGRSSSMYGYTQTPFLSSAYPVSSGEVTYAAYAPTPTPVDLHQKVSLSDFACVEIQDSNEVEENISRQKLLTDDTVTKDAFFRDLRMQELEKRWRNNAARNGSLS